MIKPKVSVVMPTFRRPTDVGYSIKSLLEGVWYDFELLVRDDGDGEDGTPEAIAAASYGDSRVRYTRNDQRLGMPENLNSGISEARGRFIAVCHDHDVYKANFLEQMVLTLDRYPNALFVHSAVEVLSADGVKIDQHIGDWPELTPGAEWLRYMLGTLASPVCALTLVRREAHERHGLYDPRYGFIADVEMWMRLSRFGAVAYVREPIVQLRSRKYDHPARSQATSLAWTLARIHRRYIPVAFDKAWERVLARTLLEYRVLRRILRAELVSLRDLLARVSRLRKRS